MRTQACITGQWQGCRLSAVPSPPVHTTWEETPPIPQDVVPFPACNAHSDLFSWSHCPLRALLWVQVRGHLTWIEHSWSTLPPANILLLLLCPGPQAWKLQAEQRHFLHIAIIQPWHVGTPEELICSSGNGTRVPLTGPSPVAKMILNGDLLVVLACQHQPLRAMSSLL